MTETRDIRLTERQIAVLIDASRRRERILRKSIDSDSGTFHRALDRKHEDLADLRSARESLEVAAEALRQRQIAAMKQRLGMD